MKMTAITCPACGAKLEYRQGARSTVCEYCGNEVVIESEASMPAPEEDAREIADRIWDLLIPVEGLEQANRELAAKTADLERLRRGREKYLSPRRPVLFAAGVAVFFLLVSIGQNEILPAVLYLLAGIALTYGTFRLTGMWSAQKAAELGRATRRAMEEAEDLRDEIARYQQDYDLTYLPEKYHNRKDITGLCEVLDSGRAYSLPVAIRVYEQEKKHQEIIDMQKEQLLLQQQRLMALQEEDDRKGRHNKKMLQEMKRMRELQEQQLEEQKRLKEDAGKNTLSTLAGAAGTAFIIGSVLKDISKLTRK